MDKNNQNLLIGILAGSAVVLVVILVLLQLTATPQIVLAGSMQDRGGDYSATVAQLSSDQEALWILDCRNKTVGIYLYDISRRRLELQQTLTVQSIREAGG